MGDSPAVAGSTYRPRKPAGERERRGSSRRSSPRLPQGPRSHAPAREGGQPPAHARDPPTSAGEQGRSQRRAGGQTTAANRGAWEARQVPASHGQARSSHLQIAADVLLPATGPFNGYRRLPSTRASPPRASTEFSLPCRRKALPTERHACHPSGATNEEPRAQSMNNLQRRAH